MTTPALPNSFTSANTIFATAINSNYTTWLSILVDGTYTHTVGGFNATTATISGNVTIGSGVSQFAAFNGAFNTHLIGSGVNVGSVTYPVGAAYVDYNTTHAGTVYFNAGTSQYIQVSSAGTSMELGGYSFVDYNSGAVTNVATLTASDVTLGTDITVSGLVYGSKVIYEFHAKSLIRSESTTSFVGVGGVAYVATNISMGYLVIRSGSIANIEYNIINQNIVSTGLASVRLYHNGSSIYTIASFTASATSALNTGVISFARNSYVVNASDTIGIAFDSYTTSTQVYQAYFLVELYEDS